MSDHTDTTLTDTERRYAYEHFGDDDEHFGRCYLEADVESIVAARVAAARADERTKWVTAIERRAVDFHERSQEYSIAKIELTAMRDYQAGHPLLTQPAPGETGDKGGQG